MIAKPVIKIFVRNLLVIRPINIEASEAERIAARAPKKMLFVKPAAAMPKKAPIAISPSSAIFSIPESSEKRPPIEAKSKGVAAAIVYLKKSIKAISDKFIIVFASALIPAIPGL